MNDQDTQKSFIRCFLEKIDAKIALRAALAAWIGLIVAHYYSHLINRPEALISGLWCVLTAIIVLQAHLGATYKAALNRFIGVLIGSILGGLMTTFLGSEPFSLALGVFLTVTVCALLGLREGYRIASVSVVIITILWRLHPEESPWTFSLFRFLDSCVGILIAVIIAHTVWPLQAVKKMRRQMIEVSQVFRSLFHHSITLEPYQPFQKKVYLDQVQQAENLLRDTRDILEESKPEMLIKSASFEEWMLLQNDFSDVLENLVALSEVYKENTQKIFDLTLNHHLTNAIEKIDQGFAHIANMIRNPKGPTSMPDLLGTLQNLNEDLNRFRLTRLSREYHLDDVENFFVFFYSLKNLLKDLQKIIQKIQILNQ